MSPSIDAEANPPFQTSFQGMLDGIRSAFNKSDCKVDVDEVWQVIESYKSSPIDWNRFAFYDPHKYKRNLVDEHEKYNVMILCWGPNTRSCIHDHSGSHCFMKILEGELVESRYAWPEENQMKQSSIRGMSKLSESRMQTNNVLYINDKVGLHQVANPSMNKTAASLHVYIPPFRKCKAFDHRTGQARDCKLSFYSKCGKVVKEDD